MEHFQVNTQNIWAAFGQHLRQYLLRRVACPADADDLLQEIFIKIHLKLNTLKTEEQLAAWIWRLTQNTLTDYYRSRKKVFDMEEIKQEPVSPTYEDSAFEWFAECVRPFLELLPPTQREAIELADFQHVSQKKLAEKWGISYSGAKSRVQRSRQDLEQLFRQCCHIEHDAYGNILDYAPHQKCTDC